MPLKKIHDLAAQDPALVQTLVGMFTAQAPVLLQQAESAMAVADGHAAKVAIHTLKGVCLNLGFDALAAACKQAESPLLAGDLSVAQPYIIEVRKLLGEVLAALKLFAK